MGTTDILDEITHELEIEPEESVVETAPEASGDKTVQEPATEAKAETEVDEPSEEKAKKTLAQEKQAWKHRARRSERRLAEFEADAQLGQNEPAPVVVPEKSPLDVFVEENAEYPEAPVPVAVLRQQKAFENQQASSERATQTAKAEKVAMARSIAVAKTEYTPDEAGEGLDFETVVGVGSGFLTDRDKEIISRSGEQAGEEIYTRCLRRAANSNTEVADEIKEALTARARRRRSATKLKEKEFKKPKTEVLTREEILAATTPRVHSERLGLGYE